MSLIMRTYSRFQNCKLPPHSKNKNVKPDRPIIIQILAKADCLRKRNFSSAGFQVIWVFLVTRKRISLQMKNSTWIFQCPIPFCDVKPVINSYINDMWQMEWDECHGNKLYDINPSVRKLFFTWFVQKRGFTQERNTAVLLGDTKQFCCGFDWTYFVWFLFSSFILFVVFKMFYCSPLNII